VLTNAAKGLRVLYTATNGIDGKATVAVSGGGFVPARRWEGQRPDELGF